MRGLIVGLPRSRTAWMSAFLSTVHPGVTHELITKCISAQNYDLYPDYMPDWIDCTTWVKAADIADCPVVYIRRAVQESLRAIANLGPAYEGLLTLDVLEKSDEYLMKRANLVVPFDSLDDDMDEIMELLGLPYNKDMHQRFKELNITTMNA